MRKILVTLFCIVFALVLLLIALIGVAIQQVLVPQATATSIPTPLPTPTQTPASIKDGQCDFNWTAYATYIEPQYLNALQDQFRLSDNLPKTPPLYKLSVNVNPANNTYSGEADIIFWNESPQVMPNVMIRSYPDFFKSVGGQVSFEKVEVNGQPANIQNQALTYSLITPQQPIPPCSQARLRLKFTGKIPNQLQESDYALGTFYAGQGVFALANFYPQLALWEKGEGKNSWDWTVAAVRPSSDLTAAESAFYDVQLQLPSTYQVIATGINTSASTTKDYTTWRFVGGPFREFAAVGGQHYTLQPLTGRTKQSDVEVKVFTLNTTEGPIASRQQDFTRKAFDITIATLDDFSRAVGPYPYVSYTLVEFPLTGFNGIEWPMFAQINVDLFQRSYAGQEQTYGGLTYSKPGTLVVAHEVLHQWWYNMVGNDQQAEPFIDEGLTEYCVYLLPELHAQYNNGSIQEAHTFAETWMDRLRDQIKHHDLPTYGDLPVSLPASQVTQDQAAFIYYRKTPLMYDSYRTKFGDTALFTFLKTYFEKNQYRIVHKLNIVGFLSSSTSPSLQLQSEAFILNLLDGKLFPK